MIDESEDEVIFNVTIISGILAKNIQIEFFTTAGSAEGRYLHKIYDHFI